MRLEEFENKFKKKKRFAKYWNHGFCMIITVVALHVLYSVVIIHFHVYSGGDKLFLISVFTFILVMGIYGLFVLRNKYKLAYWKNNFTKEENLDLLDSISSESFNADIQFDENSARFVYRKGGWVFGYEVYLFASQNLIAINVDTIGSGIIDFGASERTQNRILDLMKEKASD